MHRRRLAIAVTLAALMILAARHPTADLQLMTHDARDAAPHRLSAAVDLGVAGVSILYTWSAKPTLR